MGRGGFWGCSNGEGLDSKLVGTACGVCAANVEPSHVKRRGEGRHEGQRRIAIASKDSGCPGDVNGDGDLQRDGILLDVVGWRKNQQHPTPASRNNYHDISAYRVPRSQPSIRRNTHGLSDMDAASPGTAVPRARNNIEPSRPSSLLKPCASFSQRALRAKSLSSPLATLTSSPVSEPASYPGPRPCRAISLSRFWKAFNSHTYSRFQQRVEDCLLNREFCGPALHLLLFDIKGRTVPRKTEHRSIRRGTLALTRDMPSSCKDIRDALAACLQSSDCVMVERNKASDCLRPPLIETLPTKCQQLQKGYGECKRGMVDMRKRFRGNQPIAVSKEIEGGAQEPSRQLYGGKAAFGSTAKETSGNEPPERDWREVENEKYRKGGK